MTPPQERRPDETTWWEDEGRRITDRLRDVSSVLIAGADDGHSARVALGIARVECERRHVALGDLTGDAAPLYEVAGGEDAFGLSDCLRQGLPLNDIARPAPGGASLFILPAGSPPVACEEILAHERWPRLMNGFAQVGALLILVVRADTPGIAALASVAGGVVIVDLPPSGVRGLRVLATVAAPERTAGPDSAPPRGRRAANAFVAVVAVVAVVTAAWFGRNRIRAAFHALAVGRAAPPPAIAPVTMRPSAPPPEDTVRLTDPVNPADSADTSPFAVEVMAANTLAGANSFLSGNGARTPLGQATVSPVAVGGSANVWYKVVAGASHDRGGADSLLALLRHQGSVGSGQGRVVRVPYALVLADKLDRVHADDLTASWQRRGFNAYQLVQADGSMCVLVGAFETPAQAGPLAAALRAAGVAPVLAFRTGRTY